MSKNKKDKKPNPVASFFWKDKRRRAKNINFILMLVVAVAAIGIGFIGEKLDIMDTGDDIVVTEPQGDIVFEEEDLQMMEAISQAGSLNDYLYQWSNNGGELYSSKNVLNVLLVGLDSKDALENGGRSDSLILVSLNKKEKKIYMTSFFRDTWCYMNVANGMYSKINASYFYGGPTGLIDTIEKNFKIDIDYYVAVDFSSFVDIINALGGLTVEVQEYEAAYINRTTKHTIDYGPAVKLTGAQALVFARIRKSDADSDISRTRRQRQVITSFIESAKGASISQLNDALDMLFKYVKTDLTQMQIISYATQALANGWINYDIEQYTLSDNEVFRTGYVGNTSVVFIDLPLAAQIIQNTVYGDSNVVLDENRIKIFNLVSRFA